MIDIQSKINIIMFGMSSCIDWQKGIVNRNYHILRTLAKNELIDKIVAVDFLPLGFNQKRKLRYFCQNLVKRAKLYTNGEKICVDSGKTIFSNLTSRCYQVANKIYVYSSIGKLDKILSELIEIKKRLWLDRINTPRKKTGRDKIANLIIWSYNPFIPNLSEIKQKLSADKTIFDAVDDWSEHIVYKNKKQLLEKNYQKIKNEADILFTVSKELKDGLFGDCRVRPFIIHADPEISHKNRDVVPKRSKNFIPADISEILRYSENDRKKILEQLTGTNVHWIPNGVDLDYFKKKRRKPEELKNMKKPIVGYEGVIQNRFDIDLIKYLAEKNRDKNFVFVGWIWRGLDKIIHHKFFNSDNVYFWGRKTYNELPAYIQNFDSAIIPHKVNEFTKSMNPLKMYEYLACGKPVVSTQVSGVEEFGNLIKVAADKEEFDKYLNQVLNEDNERLKRMRIEAVGKCSWENRVEEMIKIISKS